MSHRPEPKRSVRAKIHENLVIKPRRQSNSVGHVTNVSVSGAFIATSDKITIGSEIILYLPIKMASKKSLCIVAGKVVRIEKQGELYGYGVCFKENLTVNQRNMLENFVEFKLTGKVSEGTDPEIHLPKIKLKRHSAKEVSKEKSLRERREHSRVVRNQRLQRTRTAALQWEKRKKRTLSAREALDRANHIIAMIVIGSVLLLGGAAIGWSSIKSMSIKSSVASIIPIENARISDSVYYGQVSENWINSTSDRKKTLMLMKVATELQDNGFEGAILKDQHEILIAQIIKNHLTKKLEVRLNL